MRLAPEQCCVWNDGYGAWAFDRLAADLSSLLGVDVSDKPRRFKRVADAFWKAAEE